MWQVASQTNLVAVCMGMSNIQKVAEGTEASRRVGWAKYYALHEEVRGYRYMLKRLCEAIIYNKRLRREEDLVVLATEILKSLAQKR